MIESYSFGRMTVDGEQYTSDLILFPDKIVSNWWRVSGHKLCLQDLEKVIKEKPEILIIGTGAMGAMKVKEEVKLVAQHEGITLIIEKTGKAAQVYNNHSPDKKVIGAFHLTC